MHDKEVANKAMGVNYCQG